MKECALLIIGGGPAGLSAAISASSERVSTILIESRERLGGQAGRSSLIENVLGFPDGISGEELTNRATAQAAKFGTDICCPMVARSIQKEGNLYIVQNDEFEEISARVVLLASGLSYRTLQARNLGAFMGNGVSYGMPILNTGVENQKIFIVGGANSAGQAAMNLSKNAKDCQIYILIRGDSLETGMSGYLVDRIQAASNIEVWTRTEVLEVKGDTRLRSIVISREGIQQTHEADGLHIFIGAVPKTSWVKGIVAMDEKNYILTGYRVKNKGWDLSREPLGFETSVPGIFSVGDVRYGSIKRVAAASGEGTAFVAQLHQYLSIQEGGNGK